MATHLDALVEVLTDPDERARYLREPADHLRARGLDQLCGEDVVAAGPVLQSWLPHLADALAVLEQVEPEPRLGEAELDAAIRVLAVVLGKVPLEEPDASPFG